MKELQKLPISVKNVISHKMQNWLYKHVVEGGDRVVLVGMLMVLVGIISVVYQPATLTVLVLLSSLKGLSPPVTRQV